MGERLAGEALALGYLILMVREDKILAAAVNINGVAEIAPVHRGALDMPAGSALAPRGIPCGLAGFRGFPDGEIHRLALDLADHYTRARLKILKRLMRELAVILELLGAEINVALRLIGVALFDKGRDYLNDGVDILGSLRIYRCVADIESVGVDPELFYIALGNLGEINMLLVCASDYFIVDIREILNELHIVAAIFEIAAQDIEDAQRAGVADVDIVIHGRAAGVHLDLARSYRDELFLFSCESVIDLHLYLPFSQFPVCFPAPQAVFSAGIPDARACKAPARPGRVYAPGRGRRP